MKKILSFCMAALLLLALAAPAAAAANKNLSGATFSMTDVVRNKKVTFRGGSGKPTVLLFGGVGSCANTGAYIADLLLLLRLADGVTPQVYVVDVQSNDKKTMRGVLGGDALPDDVFVGTEDLGEADGLIIQCLSALYGGGVYSYTLPLAVYLDASGEIKTGSTGSVARSGIADALGQIGVRVDTDALCAAVPFEVRYLQTEARKELQAVNALRTGDAWYWNPDNKTKTTEKNLKALTYDYALERVAMQRALELIVLYDHARPNGEDCFSAFDEQNYACGRGGENIACGQKTAAEVQTDWEETNKDYGGQGHRRNMLGRSFTAFGCACVEYNGVRFWVQEFSDTVNEAKKTPAQDGTAVRTVSVAVGDIQGWSVSPASLAVGVGQTVNLYETVSVRMTCDLNLHIRHILGRDAGLLETAFRPAWTVDDPTVASVAADGTLTGKTTGEAALSAALPQRGKEISLHLEVRDAAVDNRPVTDPVRRVGDRLYCVPGATLFDVIGFCGQDTMFDLRLNGVDLITLPDTAVTGLKVYAGGESLQIVIMGDSDADGAITASDARIALRVAVGLEDRADDAATRVACDVDGEAGVSASDARLILRGAVGLERPESWFLSVTES